MSESTEASPPLSGAITAALVGLGAVGLGVAAYLTRLHMELFVGSGVGESLCDLSASFSCSTVNGAPQSEIYGVPQAVLAIPTYLLMIALALLARRGSRAALPTLAGLGVLTVLYSAYLAYVSAVVIGAWCLFCMVLYAVNLSVTGLALWAGRGLGPLVRGLKPGFVVGSIAAGLVLFAGVNATYAQLRASLVQKAAAEIVAPPAPKLAAATNTAPVDAEVKKLRLSDKRVDVPIPADAPSVGPAKARVTIVEFSDFQCPFCKRLAGTLHQLVDEYPSDVRLVYLQFPLNLDCNRAGLKKSMHPGACDASVTSVCASQQGKFWEMHDRLFDRQGDLKRAAFLEHASDLGLDNSAFEACLDDPATLEAVAKQTELAAPLGVSGTPTFFINGRQLAGGQPIEVLRAVVDAELAGTVGALDLEVKVGTEARGAVDGAKTQVQVSLGSTSTQIDAFEASLDGDSAVSRAGASSARNISWYGARDACAAAGKRLCTEAEWLAACTGDAPIDKDGNGVFSDETITGRLYGYSERRRSGACADSRNPDAPGDVITGDHPQCGTPDGAYDLVGGVKEWVGLSPATAATKGGSYSSGESARCGYYRDDIAPDTQDPATGFRCCEGPAEIPAMLAGRDVSEKLAPFDVQLLDGKKFNTKTLAGKPTIITFWASWCGPCKKELPILAALYNQYKDQGLAVLAISVDSDEAKLKAYLASNPLPFPVARDPDGSLLDSFNNRGVPTSLWIQKDGTIRLRTTGVPPGGDKRLDELVTELLAK